MAMREKLLILRGMPRPRRGRAGCRKMFLAQDFAFGCEKPLFSGHISGDGANVTLDGPHVKNKKEKIYRPKAILYMPS